MLSACDSGPPAPHSTARPAAASRAAPWPETSGFGSRMAMTTRATPAATSASAHGGVRPWCDARLERHVHGRAAHVDASLGSVAQRHDLGVRAAGMLGVAAADDHAAGNDDAADARVRVRKADRARRRARAPRAWVRDLRPKELPSSRVPLSQGWCCSVGGVRGHGSLPRTTRKLRPSSAASTSTSTPADAMFASIAARSSAAAKRQTRPSPLPVPIVQPVATSVDRGRTSGRRHAARRAVPGKEAVIALLPRRQACGRRGRVERDVVDVHAAVVDVAHGLARFAEARRRHRIGAVAQLDAGPTSTTLRGAPLPSGARHRDAQRAGDEQPAAGAQPAERLGAEIARPRSSPRYRRRRRRRSPCGRRRPTRSCRSRPTSRRCGRRRDSVR